MNITVLINQETIITFAMVMQDCWQKREKGLESCSFMPFFCPFGRREIGEFLRIVKV